MTKQAPTSTTKWIIRDTFPGLETWKDPEKVTPGSAVSGYNCSFNRGDLITARPLGYAPYPSGIDPDSSTDPIISVHTFRLRDGTNILMRSHTTVLEFFDETTQEWITIENGYTDSAVFGFTDYNINTDQHSYVYFSNAVDSFERWSGSVTHLTADLNPSDTTVNVDDTSGFSATGNITIDGTSVAYSGLTSTTFTLSSSWSGSTITTGSTIIQSPETIADAPLGNILTTYTNRIFVAGIIATPQAVYFSEYGDATNYSGATLVTDSTATDPGIFNLAEGGGGVIGFTRDEQALYVIKPSIIYVVTLSDSFYSLEPLKPFDGKSQTMGGIATRSVFASGNGSIVITPDKRILYLTRIQYIDYPQLSPISDIIYPTVNALSFTKAAGITFEERAFIACSTVVGGQNDTVLVYNFKTQFWETPITGWNVADWVIYNNGSGDRLFFSSNNSKNIFEVIDTPSDGIFDVSSLVLMNQETFGSPAEQKFVDNLFFEGHIAENTDPLTISIYFNDNGFTQILQATIAGTDTELIFATNAINVFGFNPFGLQVFGSNPDTSGKRKFRLYTKNDLRRIPFYNIQVGFSAEGTNQNWDIINYGFKVGIYENPENRQLYVGFN